MTLSTDVRSELHKCGCGHLLASHDGGGCMYVAPGFEPCDCTEVPSTIETTYAAVERVLEAAQPDRVQVGWYCNHEDEPHDERTHLREYAAGKKRPKGGREPNTYKALTFGTYPDGGAPPCPRAVPVYTIGGES